MLQLKYLLVGCFLLNIGCRGVQAFECDEFQWKCESGECIESESLCDGEVNCMDGSDETAKHCIHIKCPKYAFRCSYGACIPGSAKCNGIRNCADNSDEFEFLCNPDDEYLERKLQGNCSEPISMQCKNGECIDGEYRCDGVPNCSDASDEIVEVCSHIFCPSYAFHCGYGACIPGNAKCDGNIDCLDGSDETDDLCGYEYNTNGTRKKPTLRPTKVPTDLMPQGCYIPYDRMNLIVLSTNDVTKRYKLGDHIASNTRVEFDCPYEWQLKGKKRNMCVNNKWLTKVPTCLKYCSADTLRRGISTNVTCHYNNHKTKCFGKPLRIGTKAEISCAPGYKMPTTQRKQQKTLTCDEHAEWDYPKFRCVPDCGTIQESIQISEQPWEVSIFKREKVTEFGFICSGAIISPKVIISAGNCFTTSSYTFGNDPSSYNIVEGRNRANYTQSFNTGVIMHNISEIITPEYPADQNIALLVLVNYIHFSTVLKPLCLTDRKVSPNRMYDELVPFGNQNEIFVKGYTLNMPEGDRRSLDSVVVETYRDGRVKLLQANLFKKLIKKVVNRFSYIL